MKYPIVQANSNGRAVTSTFLGINRLPEGTEGEGTEFRNLSLELYPAAATGGLSDTGEALYIKNDDGEKESIDFTKLQAVADVHDDGGVMYLTGVYDGDFYYEGIKRGYYKCDNDAFLISAGDKIQIEKFAKTYVIFAKKENSSVVWSYNENGTDDVADKDAREKDGLLVTEIVKHTLLLNSADDSVMSIYRMCASEVEGNVIDNNTARLEKVTGKEYYFMYPTKKTLFGLACENDSNGKKIIKDIPLIEEYNSLVGARIKLRTYLSDFDDEHYSFNDNKDEHPVVFVVDAAGTGDTLGDNIKDIEAGRYGRIDFNISQNFFDSPVFYPYYINTEKKSAEIKCYNVYGTENVRGLVWPTMEGKKNIDSGIPESGMGIIGHFEKWNDEIKRYDPYNTGTANAIWKRVFINENGEKEELKPLYSSGNSGEVVSYYSEYAVNSYNTIPIKSIGIETEGVRLSHMTAYKGRIFACVNDGSMLVASELGSYTDFGEFEGVSTDSGYFNSLTSGKYTGISEYQGTLVVFKADRISVYYGDTPSDMVLSHEIKNVGCIDSDSIKEVGGVLYFLGRDGFYAYSGGQPQCISRKLGKVFKSAKAFVHGRRYYAATEDELLIYDTDTGAWTSSEKIEIKAICGERLFLADGSIKKVLGNDEWSGEWTYESMDIFEDIIDDKGINELYIRAKLDGELEVKTVTDGEERSHMTITDNGERVKVWRVPVKLLHGNYYRIRLEGKGKCILYAIERKCYAGGRVR